MAYEHLPEIGKETRFTSENQPLGENKGKGKLMKRLLTDRLEKVLSEEKEVWIEGEDEQGVKRKIKVKNPNADVIVMALLQNAAKGKEKSIEMVFERIEGKSPQTIQLSDPDGGPVRIKKEDLENLTDEDLRKLIELQSKVRPGTEEPS